jgi:predicted NAD-dependent protein-ADP-ribosyltransferase YbiA (DUF1768 family)
MNMGNLLKQLLSKLMPITEDSSDSSEKDTMSGECTVKTISDEIKYTGFGYIVHKLKGTIGSGSPCFRLPEWDFYGFCREKEDGQLKRIKKDCSPEEELTSLGLRVEYPDDEEQEKCGRETGVKICVDWERINLDSLKAFLFPLEKWGSYKYQAVYIWTYACMTLADTVDIDSRGCYPSFVLSNLYPSRFELDGVEMNSMEGFLQSLKTSDEMRQREICSLMRKEAKKAGRTLNFDGRRLHWQGKTVDRFSDEYQSLLRRAFAAKLKQDDEFRDALTATSGKKLVHSIGKQNPKETILTEKEYINILDELRIKLTFA